jgi:hypothetical protein
MEIDQKVLDGYKLHSLKELAEELRDVKAGLDRIAQEKADAQRIYDYLRLILIPERMEVEDTENVEFAGVGKLILTSDVYAAIPAAARDEAYEWLRDNGHGALIKDSVHNSTLKAFAKDMIRDGAMLPEQLFSVKPFTRASLRKTKNT